ncbi:restriction endonuclease subunit S [Bifidobacterium sp. ESL0728]|uniref:restriction endonuclease subunit S n=1 Tax=Bifidobacterium sp. ESL0728 TaxID=2983220 RepID=UPI0023F80C73|nr:restriction endonuclease subunit S [Bifidobacterium sp. ESL0728]WEV59538.1 restriction endonuclease subunit S [Bifidobacterium sp. ESL0728]
MSNIEKLLTQLCPDGVTYLPLKDVADIKNGKDYKHLGAGNISVYGSGGKMDVKVDAAAYDKPTVLLPRKGSISNIFYVDEPFWNVDTIFYTIIDTARMIPRFLYYVMLNEHIENLGTSSAARPSLTQSVLKEILVPVPPLKVQQEILRILDTFTELESELESELELRKIQFNFYKGKLFAFMTNAEWLELGDLVNILDTQRKPVTRGDRESGQIPYYGANGIQDYVKHFIFDGTFLLVGEDGSVLTEAGKPVLNWATGKIWVNNHAHILEQRENKPMLRYIMYALSSIDISELVHGTPPKLTQKSLRTIRVPVPSLAEQQRIIDILDRFNLLTTSSTDGLPAEIAARHQQYEYYRNKLLDFPRKKTEA